MGRLTPDSTFLLGDRTLFGQTDARKKLGDVLRSERLGHAYLFCGPTGLGKLATALAFAEAIQGIENLSTMGSARSSEKKAWYNHPDIHVFFAMIKDAGETTRVELHRNLATDPYFPVAQAALDHKNSDSRNKKTFYPIEYFRSEILTKTQLRPNEGNHTVIIIHQIEKMRKEAANAFLKTLEEPADRVLFVMTSDRPEQILPTVLSRCQMIAFKPFQPSELEREVINKFNLTPEVARSMVSLSAGQLQTLRTIDFDALEKQRSDAVMFLRKSWNLVPGDVLPMVEAVTQDSNQEQILQFLLLIDLFLKDVRSWKACREPELLAMPSEQEAVANLAGHTTPEQLEAATSEIAHARLLVARNVNVFLTLTVMAIRLNEVFRKPGKCTIHESRPWRHAPTYYGV